MRTRPIWVRKSTREYNGRIGYRWTCDLCPRSGGFHGFGRWTDYVLAKRGKEAEHPWIRAMAGANLHYHRYHAPRAYPAPIQVTIHQANITMQGTP
jgi:hypothetical protein